MDVATQEAPVWVNGLLNRDFDLSFDTVDRAALDPAATLATHVFYPPNSVVSKYTSPEVDNLLAAGAAKLTVAERRPYYWEYQRLWNQNVWGLILGNIDIASGGTHRVQGYIENSDSFRNFRHTYLSQ
jgi:ABC-type transport system substrate-binding protein